jgi:hypothetical protein
MTAAHWIGRTIQPSTQLSEIHRQKGSPYLQCPDLM